MVKKQESGTSNDKDDEGPAAREDAETVLSEMKAEEHEAAEPEALWPPVDPLDRAKSEMEEVSDAWTAAPEERDEPSPDPTDEHAAAEPKPDGESEAAGSAEEVVADVTEEARPAEEDAQETAEEKHAEPVTTAPQPAPPPQVVKGSMWPGVFGGVIAALVGFIVGRGDALDQYLPASLQRPAVDTSAIEAATAAMAEQTAELGAQTAQLVTRAEELVAEVEAQGARVAALEAAPAAEPAVADLSEIDATLAQLATRIEALESRPAVPEVTGASEEAVEALESALAAQNAEIAALAERAEAAEARAAGEAARLLARSALIRVQTAVDSGDAFAPALSELEEVAPVEVPDALREAAEAGVPTLAALQDSFPEAARAGLAAARAEVPESEVSGITGFLKRQLNVRSVTPREGSDPDAILSRAQAAVRAGDLGSALAEMEALPESARAAMNDWLEAASARKAAQDAASELADSLNSN